MIPRPKLAAVVLLILASCERGSRPSLPAPAPAAAASALTADSKPPVTWSDSIKATELAGIRASEGRVSRAGSDLRIQLLDGKIAIFSDDTTAGSQYAVYRYAGHLKPIHSHIVHRVPYEGSGIYLVLNDSTGDSTIVHGMPVLSPDGTRFALTSQSEEADYDPSLIEVWRVVDGKPENEFSYDAGNGSWDPSDAVWRDSVTIDFIKTNRAVPINPYVKTAARLTRIGTTWSLNEGSSATRTVTDTTPHKDPTQAELVDPLQCDECTAATRHSRFLTGGEHYASGRLVLRFANRSAGRDLTLTDTLVATGISPKEEWSHNCMKNGRVEAFLVGVMPHTYRLTTPRLAWLFDTTSYRIRAIPTDSISCSILPFGDD